MPHTKPFGPSSIAAFLFVVSWVPVSAQSVTGTVLDPMDTVVPGATLTLRDASGAIHAEAVLGPTGEFELGIPRPGQYRIHAEAREHETTVSPLFSLEMASYEVDIELRATPSLRMGSEIPRERILEWIWARSSDARTREIIVITGQEWRDLAQGRDMVEALRSAGLPKLSVRRTAQDFCVTSGSSARCMSVTPLGHGALPRLRDIGPDEVEAVVYLGPTVRSAPMGTAMGWQERMVNAEILLFLHGYLEIR